MTLENASGGGPDHAGEKGKTLAEELMSEGVDGTDENPRARAVQAAMAGYEPFDLAAELPRMRAELGGLRADAATNGLGEEQAKLRELRAQVKPGAGSHAAYLAHHQEKNVKHIRADVDQRRAEYVREAATQDLGIARTLGTLFHQIHQPDTTSEQLWATVAAAAPKYRLNETQLTQLHDGLDEYAQKHAVVGQCRRDYPDDKDLFRFVFGFVPQGDVEVVECPMAIYIKCSNEQDYARAYHRLGAGSPLTAEQQRTANLSAGAALGTMANPDLNGIVTLENSPRLPRGFDQVERRQQLFLGPRHAGFLNTARIKTIEFTSDNGQEWRIEQAWSPDAPDLEFRVVQADDPDSPVHEFVINDAGDVWQNGQRRPTQEGECYLGGVRIVITDFEISITPSSNIDVYILGTNDIYSSKPSAKKSAFIQLHEEQHQFNKLFQPLRTASEAREVALRVARQDLPPDVASLQFVSAMARERRVAMGVDERMRDEIIAYVQEGEAELGEIRDTLKTAEAYDLKKVYSKQITNLTSEIARDYLAYNDVFIRDRDPAAPHPITRVQIEEEIAKAFGPDHKRNIDRWTGAAEELAGKDYMRDEVVGLLYQWPVHRWPALARSMPRREEITGVPL
ncbi:MAG TPA: hypothetical protein VHQ86_01155 [Candidatus Saccharimonadia bacterium]|jgi:ribosomal protein L29|nr:hypothetical protein [Candidatus Saccharimonadia bacterium]